MLTEMKIFDQELSIVPIVSIVHTLSAPELHQN